MKLNTGIERQRATYINTDIDGLTAPQLQRERERGREGES